MAHQKEHKYEAERLKELESYSILDTLEESDYDDITAIASEICNAPISLISLLDNKRQWFKSHHGLDISETPKEYAFCSHAIKDSKEIFIINDARKDNRFSDNPIVTGNPNVIFYAGVPLLSDNSLPLGTLCVIDNKPNTLSEKQIKSLKSLANQVMNTLNLRKTKFTLEKTLRELEEKNRELEQFAYVAAHDLKSPLSNIYSLSHLLLENNESEIDGENKKMLKLIRKSSKKLKSLIDALLDYSKSNKTLKEKKVSINLDEFIDEILELLNYSENLLIVKNFQTNIVIVNKTILEQIFLNLIVNAIKYNDKKKIKIEFGSSQTDTHYQFYIKDNGPGISLKNQKKIFDIFNVSAKKDRYGKSGTGIGLATIKKVVGNFGGVIKIESELKKGAKFSFTLEK